MPPRDAVEFTAAFVLGTLLGAGLAQLLLSGRRRRGSPRERAGFLTTLLDSVVADTSPSLPGVLRGRRRGPANDGDPG